MIQYIASKATELTKKQIVAVAFFAITTVISGPEFLAVFAAAIAVYFGTQVERKAADK